MSVGPRQLVQLNLLTNQETLVPVPAGNKTETLVTAIMHEVQLPASDQWHVGQ
jgi:hypothetical protein